MYNMFKSVQKLSKIYSYTCNINRICIRFAGHSKWANIKHIKGLKDAERASLFTKLSRQIKVAVQEGGSIDPNANLKLEQVISQAKRVNMPAATIQNILKSTQSDKKQCKSYTLEIKGPGSCLILCEVFTDAIHQLKMSIATILRKNGGKYCEGIINSFQEKGIIEVEVVLDESTNKDTIIEKATDDAIEVGAEEVSEVEDNILQFICGGTNLKAVTEGLEKHGYRVFSSSIEYIPFKYQSLSEDNMRIYGNLYEKLDKLPEVTRISHNIEE